MSDSGRTYGVDRPAWLSYGRLGPFKGRCNSTLHQKQLLVLIELLSLSLPNRNCSVSIQSIHWNGQIRRICPCWRTMSMGLPRKALVQLHYPTAHIVFKYEMDAAAAHQLSHIQHWAPGKDASRTHGAMRLTHATRIPIECAQL